MTLPSELLALLATACSALSSMFIGELRGRVGVLRLARWQMLTALAITGLAALALGRWHELAVWHIGFLAASSVFGIIMASSTFFAAIYTVGPRVTALFFSLASPFALLLGYIALGETISPRQGFGVVAVLAGIMMAVGFGNTADGEGSDTPRGKIPWRGVAFGVVTAFGQALGSLCARPVMAAGVEPFTAMAIRAAVAALFFSALPLLPLKVLRAPYSFARRDLVMAMASACIGTGLGVSLLLAALAHGTVGIVSTLSSMTPVLILPMVWIRRGEAPAPTAWLGALCAVAGTGLISL